MHRQKAAGNKLSDMQLRSLPQYGFPACCHVPNERILFLHCTGCYLQVPLRKQLPALAVTDILQLLLLEVSAAA